MAAIRVLHITAQHYPSSTHNVLFQVWVAGQVGGQVVQHLQGRQRLQWAGHTTALHRGEGGFR